MLCVFSSASISLVSLHRLKGKSVTLGEERACGMPLSKHSTCPCWEQEDEQVGLGPLSMPPANRAGRSLPAVRPAEGPRAVSIRITGGP